MINLIFEIIGGKWKINKFNWDNWLTKQIYPFLPIYIKINSRCAKKLNVKNKEKEETLEKFYFGMGKFFLIME